MASTSERGYGTEHQRLRADWQTVINETGGVDCARCGDVRIKPGDAWDLGHDDHDRSKYTGPECIPCNRGTGGRNGAAVTNAKHAVTIREW